MFGPPALSPGATARLLVSVHPPAAEDSVRTLARATLPGCVRLAGGPADGPVGRGDAIGLHLAIRGGGVDRPAAGFTWRGRPRAERFEVRLPAGATGPLPASVSLTRNGASVGRVGFDLAAR